MFEIVLSTIENKLQRVENLDRAVHHLMRKMDMMERKLTGKDSEIMTAIQALEKETHEAHVSVKLNQLSAKLDTLCSTATAASANHARNVGGGHDDAGASGLEDEQDILVALPSNRQSRVLHDAGMEDVKEVISGIDRRLGVHINIVSENLGKMSHMVEEVRDVLIDDSDEPQLQTNSSDGHGQPKQRSKFDKLLSSIHPLLVVRNDAVR